MQDIIIKHPNGFTGRLYGESSLMISGPNYHLHTGFRTINTKEDLYDFLGDMPNFVKLMTSIAEETAEVNKSRKAVTNMGYTKKEKTASAEAEVKKITMNEIEVRRAGVVNDTTVGFDLTIRGIGISGFYIRICKDKNGEEFKVISKPSKKGKDGKYYDQVFIPGFTKEIQEAIIEKVESLL